MCVRDCLNVLSLCYEKRRATILDEFLLITKRYSTEAQSSYCSIDRHLMYGNKKGKLLNKNI